MTLTDRQIDQAFRAVLGVPARSADIAVLRAMGTATPGEVGEYIWDHHMGEPDTPTEDQVVRAVEQAVGET